MGSASEHVLLLHGLGDTCRLFKDLKPFLEQRGWIVHCLNLVPNNGDSALEVLAGQAARYIESDLPAGVPVNLVGFSMGGLVARYYAQRLDPEGRLRRLVTISSPHSGTWTAYLRWNPGARQMRPGSAFLRDLDQGREVLKRAGFTSIWTPFDLMILPAKSSVMPQARVVRLNISHHARMIRHPRVLQAVERALRG
jgi:triacylglycerol lipase